MDKVFVTGANGLLGTNLVLLLLEKGFSVVAMVRNKNSFVKPELKNLKLVEGNLLDKEKLYGQMRECKYVVHIAANTSQNLLTIDDYYPVNVQGTKNIIAACVKNKIEKLVYIGTANTYGFGSLSNPGNESKVMKYPFTKSLYASSKQLAQNIVDETSSRLNITTISPTFMLGTYDTKPSSGKIILTVLNKKMAFYPSGGKNFVHVKDVAQAIVNAFEIKKSGEKYILANENISYKDFFEKAVALNQQKTRLIPLPDFALSIIGLIGDIMRFLRIRTNISSANTKILVINNYYSNQKAKKELKISFTPIDKAIIDAIRYFNIKQVL